MSEEIPNLRQLDNGWNEGDCVKCGETVLFRKGDQMHIYVDRPDHVAGILCSQCYKEVDHP